MLKASEPGIWDPGIWDPGIWDRVHRRGTSTPVDPDLELLQRWRGGDRAAGSTLLARHFNLLRVYFLGRVPERQIEDLIQDVFLRMVEALARFEGRSSVRSFLVGIARNVAREALRELYRPNGRFNPLEESLHAISGRTIFSIYAAEQELQLLLDALQHITSEQHDIIEFYYFHGLALQEIADTLEIPLGTAKSRVAAARRDLLREFMSLLGPDAEAWTEAKLDRGLTRVRDAVLRGRPRKPD